MRARVGTRLAIAALMFVGAACETSPAGTGRAVEPIFTGAPRFDAIRPKIRQAIETLGAPTPKFKRLVFEISDPTAGHPVGRAIITLRGNRGSYALIRQEVEREKIQSSCRATTYQDAISVAEFYWLQSVSKQEVRGCAGSGPRTYQDRAEVAEIEIVSGSLFPMEVGKRVVLHSRTLGSRSKTDDGLSQFAQESRTVIHVRQRIPEYRLSNGRKIGEVFVLETTKTIEGNIHRKLEEIFSPSLGWLVARTGEERVELKEIVD